MKFKLSKMSKKKQIAIAGAVAAGASAAALVILGAKAPIQVAKPVGAQEDRQIGIGLMGDVRQLPLMDEERRKREENFKFTDKAYNSVD